MFRLNWEIYGINHRIKSKYEKNTPFLDTFPALQLAIYATTF